MLVHVRRRVGTGERQREEEKEEAEGEAAFAVAAAAAADATDDQPRYLPQFPSGVLLLQARTPARVSTDADIRPRPPARKCAMTSE